MEKVLYDIYIAEAEINNHYAIFSIDSSRRKTLLNSVLKKHKITEAVLDSSLVWYSGHLDRYFRINGNINKRLTEAAEKLRLHEELKTTPDFIADHFVFPVEKERFLLRLSDSPNNVYSFRADTVINQRSGIFELQFTILGLSNSMQPIVTLCVQCIDTVFVKRDTISRDGLFVTSVDVQQAKQIKNLFGTIYFPKVYPEMIIFIQNFTLSHALKPRELSITQPTE